MPAVQVPEGPTTEPSMKAIVARGARRPPARQRPRRGGPGREPGKKRSPLVVVLVVAVLGVGGAVAWQRLHPTTVVVGLDQGAGDAKAAAVAFQEAKNLIRKGLWHQAVAQLEQARALDPGHEGLQPYLDAAKVELPFQEHLDGCAAALDKGELARAAKELAQVSDNTQQLDRRNQLKAKLGKAADEKLGSARALLGKTGNKDSMRQLKAISEDVLAVRAQDRDALSYLEAANRALNFKPADPPPPDPGDPAAGVVSSYAGGDATGAFTNAEACAAANARCEKLKAQIAEVTGLLKRVESLDVGELERAVKLDRAIAGGLTAVGKPAGVRLAAQLLPKASSAAARKQWGAALATAKKILEGDPGNPNAQNIVSDARQAAQELYQRCYVGRVQTPDDSLPLCKEVVEMLPEGDELRGKAQRILEQSRPE